MIPFLISFMPLQIYEVMHNDLLMVSVVPVHDLVGINISCLMKLCMVGSCPALRKERSFV